MKRIRLLLPFLGIFLSSIGVMAQVNLTTSGTAVVIDFENTVSGVNNGNFAGTGFTPSPLAGQLDSDAWEMLGMSTGSLNYGGTGTSGDFAKGISTGGVSSGGTYAFIVNAGDTALGIHPGGSDFTPGTLTLKVTNNTGAAINSFQFAYDLYINNDATRGNSFNSSYSLDSISYTSIPSLNDTSDEASQGSVLWVQNSKMATISATVADGASFYLRWESDDVSGGGSRDEFAIDNISITGLVGGGGSLTVSTIINNNISCNAGSNGSIIATASGGTTPYTYLWSNGDTTSVSNGLSAGTYTITITDNNGSVGTSMISVAEPSKIITSTAITNTTAVSAADGAIDLTVSGGTPGYSYLWSNANITEDILNLVSGTYTVTITDTNGCIHVDTATVQGPSAITVTINSLSVSCNGGSDGAINMIVFGGTMPYTYSWSNLLPSTANQSNLLAGNYNVTISDAVGTIVIDSALITEPSAIVTSLSIINASSTGASDGMITANVAGGVSPYTYNWSSSATTTPNLTNLGAGNYCVTVSDANGCTDVSCGDVLAPGILAQLVISEINYNGPEGGIDTSEFIEFVNVGMNTINLNGYNFVEGVAHTFTASDSISVGQYFVIAYDSAAFRNRYGINANAVWNSGGLSNGGEDITITDNFGRTVDSVDFDDSAPWPSGAGAGEPDGGGASIELIDSTSNNNDGVNWIASTSVIAGVIVNGNPVYGTPGSGAVLVGIENKKLLANEISIYPNPTNGIITIASIETFKNTRVQVISIDGRVLKDELINQSKLTIDMSEFSNGIYFVRLGDKVQKLILNK